jgi:hypothetical protein
MALASGILATEAADEQTALQLRATCFLMSVFTLLYYAQLNNDRPKKYKKT